ncbi:MAG: hypothetical protein ACLUHA_08130 [Bacteroides stercoris]
MQDGFHRYGIDKRVSRLAGLSMKNCRICHSALYQQETLNYDSMHPLRNEYYNTWI